MKNALSYVSCFFVVLSLMLGCFSIVFGPFIMAGYGLETSMAFTGFSLVLLFASFAFFQLCQHFDK